MKQTLFFLLCVLVLLPGCSKDENMGSNQTNSLNEKVRWYGVKTVKDEISTRGVAQRDKLWSTGTTITVKFLNDPYNMAEKVKTYAKEWEQYANIKFEFVNSSEKANIRIGFDWNDSKWVTWSYTGTDAKYIKDQGQATVNFAFWDSASEIEKKADVLRIFGQVLGLELEHRHLKFDAGWTSRIQDYWEGEIEDIPWDELKEYVFDPIETRNLVQTEQYDENSIMIWPFNRKYATSTARDYNYELSENDKTFIAQLYPKNNNTLPTIQEAWVDAGFFRWTDDTKTAVRITELGEKQDTLPDVSDGDRLKSANRMFTLYNGEYDVYGTQLKKVPNFSTSNVTDFSRMFLGCFNLTTIPLLDTSNGTDFSRMFTACTNLKTIPLLDTSNGITFYKMFSTCISLKSIPKIDTSKGQNFELMFYKCETLLSVPELDTSEGVNFTSMFTQCYSLPSVPYLNTSKGTRFSNMFWFCQTITTIPLLDTSNGTDFSGMFYKCISLSSIPLINTSKGTDFNMMFLGCNRLKTIPLLDTTNGTDFGRMFSESLSLTNIPLLNTSKGTDFGLMFYDCRSLTSIPNIDTSKGTSFGSMFKNCFSLTSIPKIDTSKGTSFGSMFSNCVSLTSIPNIDTSNGISFSYMFDSCKSLTSIPNINTSNGNYFGSMFKNCVSLQEKPNLDLSKAINIKDMYLDTPFANSL